MDESLAKEMRGAMQNAAGKAFASRTLQKNGAL